MAEACRHAWGDEPFRGYDYACASICWTWPFGRLTDLRRRAGEVGAASDRILSSAGPPFRDSALGGSEPGFGGLGPLRMSPVPSGWAEVHPGCLRERAEREFHRQTRRSARRVVQVRCALGLGAGGRPRAVGSADRQTRPQVRGGTGGQTGLPATGRRCPRSGVSRVATPAPWGRLGPARIKSRAGRPERRAPTRRPGCKSQCEKNGNSAAI